MCTRENNYLPGNTRISLEKLLEDHILRKNTICFFLKRHLMIPFLLLSSLLCFLATVTVNNGRHTSAHHTVSLVWLWSANSSGLNTSINEFLIKCWCWGFSILGTILGNQQFIFRISLISTFSSWELRVENASFNFCLVFTTPLHVSRENWKITYLISIAGAYALVQFILKKHVIWLACEILPVLELPKYHHVDFCSSSVREESDHITVYLTQHWWQEVTLQTLKQLGNTRCWHKDKMNIIVSCPSKS